MQNILIVCIDKDLRKDISKVLSTELGFLYVDVDEILDFEILNTQDVNLKEASQIIKELERKSIERSLKFKDCIITMSRDLFVANDNFLLFKDCKKVFVRLPKSYLIARGGKDKYSIDQQIELFDKINKLVAINCNITIDKDILSIHEIVKAIKENLKI